MPLWLSVAIVIAQVVFTIGAALFVVWTLLWLGDHIHRAVVALERIASALGEIAYEEEADDE